MTIKALHPSPDYVSDYIRRAGHAYEHAVLAQLVERLERLEPGQLIDVGAMIGNHSAYLASRLPACPIAAFEPWPASRELLRQNVAAYPQVEVYPYALADWTGTAQMQAEPGNIGHAYLTEEGGAEFVEVRTLDSFAFEEVRLIKIDVEGWEPIVLRGAWQTLNRWHPLVALEDWTGGNYGGGLPAGYRLAAEWERQHQVYLYEWH